MVKCVDLKLLSILVLMCDMMCWCLQGAGKYRQQGRNHMVEDCDIIFFFKFNAGAGLTAKKEK